MKRVVAQVHVDKIQTATEYRVQVPTRDGTLFEITLTEPDARELHDALGRLLPSDSSYYLDPTSTSARSQ